MDFKIVGKNKIITIDLYDFCENFEEFYETTVINLDETKFDLCDEEIQKVTAELGLRFCNYYNRKRYYKFKIVDEKKWMLTRIKYGL